MLRVLLMVIIAQMRRERVTMLQDSCKNPGAKSVSEKIPTEKKPKEPPPPPRNKPPRKKTHGNKPPRKKRCQRDVKSIKLNQTQLHNFSKRLKQFLKKTLLTNSSMDNWSILNQDSVCWGGGGDASAANIRII